MTDEEKYKEISRGRKLASNVVAAAILIAAGALLLALGMATDVDMSKLVVPVVLTAIGLILFVSALIQFNTVTLYLSMLFLLCAAVSFVAHYSPAGYDKLWPTYILAPAVASLATMFMSGEYKFHLRLIVLFAVPAILLSLMSFGIAEMRGFIKHLRTECGKTILISSHILSEIALLADDIGIIDHGVLLEESTMKTLEKKNRKYILLRVSDISKAMLILEQKFRVSDFDMYDDHTLCLYDTSLDMAAINRVLVMHDVSVISFQLCNDTLENYFKKITGGDGIA